MAPVPNTAGKSTLFAQFSLYGVSGALALAVHLALMHMLISRTGMDAKLASGCGFIAAIPVNFLLQKYFVFRSHERMLTQFYSYVVITLAMLIFNTLMFAVILEATGLHYIHVQIAVTLAIFAANFLINRFFTFRSRRAGATR